MIRLNPMPLLAALALLVSVAGEAAAHFIFVVPDPAGGTGAIVVFSETLEPDEDVEVALIGGATLVAADAEGRQAPVVLGKPDAHAYRVDLGSTPPRVVRGSLVFGVKEPRKAGGKPFLISYHPKAILGDPFDPPVAAGGDAAAEIVPVAGADGVAFQVLGKGKPAAAAEVTVIRPDGEEEQVTTDADGRTKTFAAAGRYGAWARVVESTVGEHGGKPYGEIRHYPTLVIDAPAAPAARAAADVPAGDRGPAPLPEATSSFGAAVAGGWLYVYGGHTAPTHTYHTAAVSGRFHRMKLGGPTGAAADAWEELPGGPALQGMNLAAHGGKLYRVGGMRPRNAKGEKADNVSVADCAVFDPAAARWSAFAALPAPRSSHDVVTLGDRLFVVGGWEMLGRADGERWPDTALVLDLKADRPEWTAVPQPFRRRALIAAAHQDKVYAIGGFDEDDTPSRRVDVYDPAAGGWSAGPELPGPARNGFGPAACTADGRLYVSVADGSLYRLDDAAGRWDRVAVTTPRIVHRLVPTAGHVLVIGGAAKGDNLDLIESVPLTGDAAAAAAAGAAAASSATAEPPQGAAR